MITSVAEQEVESSTRVKNRCETGKLFFVRHLVERQWESNRWGEYEFDAGGVA